MKYLLIAVIAFLMSGCKSDETFKKAADKKAADLRNYSWVGDRHVFTDPETGCQYFSTYEGGMQPRLGTDGFPLCGNSTWDSEQ